jgi:hypothetical protein
MRHSLMTSVPLMLPAIGFVVVAGLVSWLDVRICLLGLWILLLDMEFVLPVLIAQKTALHTLETFVPN